MKNFKKIVIGLSLMLMLALCPFMLMACEEKTDGIKLHSEFKTEYYVGEELDVTGGILEYTKDGKEYYVELKKDMVVGSTFSTETTGTRNMIISHEDFTITVSYTVKNLDVIKGVYYKTNIFQSETGANIMFLMFGISDNTIKMTPSNDGTPNETPELSTTFNYTTDILNGKIIYSLIGTNSNRAEGKIIPVDRNTIKWEHEGTTAEGYVEFTIYNP